MSHFDGQLRIDNKIRAEFRALLTAGGGAKQRCEIWLVDAKIPLLHVNDMVISEFSFISRKNKFVFFNTIMPYTTRSKNNIYKINL